MVGQHIEISNRFICDYAAVFQIAKQCKTLSCHKSPFVKGGFRGNVVINAHEIIDPDTMDIK